MVCELCHPSWAQGNKPPTPHTISTSTSPAVTKAQTSLVLSYQHQQEFSTYRGYSSITYGDQQALTITIRPVTVTKPFLLPRGPSSSSQPRKHTALQRLSYWENTLI